MLVSRVPRHAAGLKVTGPRCRTPRRMVDEVISKTGRALRRCLSGPTALLCSALRRDPRSGGITR